MSFPDPYPPHFMPRPFVDDVGGCWPVHSLDHSGFPLPHLECPDLFLYSEQAPPLKRPRNSENNSPSYAQFIQPTNPRANLPTNPAGSKGTSHIFYKTRMCAKFLEGNCKNGPNCTFAHGIEDMREPPPNWQDLVRERDAGTKSWNDDQRLIHTMKLCRKFYNGEECPYGQNCNFLHERPDPINFTSPDEMPKSRIDKPVQRESSAISIGTRGSAMGNEGDYDRAEIIKPMNSNPDALRTKAVYWKTKLCSKWEVTGQCPFGERCHFAHGQSELHVPSAQVDADFRVNSSSILMKPVAGPINDSSPANVEVGAQVKDTREDKNSSRWKPKKKINKIYGDWIDNLTPRHGSPIEVDDW